MNAVTLHHIIRWNLEFVTTGSIPPSRSMRDILGQRCKDATFSRWSLSSGSMIWPGLSSRHG
jgi:hypothetical protein